MTDFQELTYVRMQSLPKDFVVSIGGCGDITKEEALEHIAENDEIGKMFIMMDQKYFDALKQGRLYESFDN